MKDFDRGSKRKCTSCSTLFFDFNKAPISCPACGAVLTSLLTNVSKRGRPPKSVKPNKEAKKLAEKEKININSFNIIYELLDFIKKKMSGLLTPDVQEKIIGSAEVLEIFKVSKVGKVAGSKVIEGEILQDSDARIIRDGTVIFTGKIGTIFREKNQTKQVTEGLECGITIKNFTEFQKKDIIEVYNSTVIERNI